MDYSILVCDDEENTRNILEYVLRDKGYKVFEADSILKSLNIIENERIDIILTDMIIAHENGMDLLKKIKTLKLNIPVIFLTAYGTIQSAVTAMTEGAFSYLLKPINYESLLDTVKRAESKVQTERHNKYLKEEISRLREIPKMLIFASEKTEGVINTCKKAAKSDVPVLISGETGVGKEMFALFVHKESERNERPFVTVDCKAAREDILNADLFGYAKGGFSEEIKSKLGKFEIADKGTLLLKNIDEMTLSVQGKILKSIEEGSIERLGALSKTSVNVRVIATSKKDLKSLSEEGDFDKDLYYKLNVINITVPPLRERTDDIKSLAEHFLKLYKNGNKEIHIEESVYPYFEKYNWPGNVLELRNMIERYSILSENINLKNMPSEMQSNLENMDLKKMPLANLSLKSIEKEAIRQTLISVKGNRRKASEMLEITRQTLYSKIKDYSL